MKEKLLFTILFLLSIRVFAQEVQLPINQETKLIEFTGLVTVDTTLTKNELYSKTKEWFAKSFKSANDVIQMDDKEAGIIIGKGNFSDRKSCGIINFTLKVQVKDGRYKYWFSNFKHEEVQKGWSGGLLENEKPDCGYFFMAKRVWIKYIPAIVNQNVKLMIQSLKKSLSKGSNDSDNAKW